ncbi:enoyl-CoA hydratase/isomerase family protein [Novosphingobium colocasiae]|nr:enoyl-CoA hydratase/isomerase family protein [Novosphingobium colocasiae]
MNGRYDQFTDLAFEQPAPHVLRVILNRPGRMNAVNAQLHRQLHEIWPVIDRDPDVRVVILTGAGRAFCAGGDMGDIAAEAETDSEQVFVSNFRAARELVDVLINFSKPVVSAINGPAVGAGLALALLSDISIAARDAKLLDGHLRIGLTAGDHAAIIWPLLCGMAKAKLHLMTNRPLTGEDAANCNLISMAVDKSELEATALEVAQELAAVAPTALAMTKHVLNHWLREKRAIFELSAAFEMVNMAGGDAREAIRAMNAGSSPIFRPRTHHI